MESRGTDPTNRNLGHVLHYDDDSNRIKASGRTSENSATIIDRLSRASECHLLLQLFIMES
jgi:hypothetical protein